MPELIASLRSFLEAPVLFRTRLIVVVSAMLLFFATALCLTPFSDRTRQLFQALDVLYPVLLLLTVISLGDRLRAYVLVGYLVLLLPREVLLGRSERAVMIIALALAAGALVCFLRQMRFAMVLLIAVLTGFTTWGRLLEPLTTQHKPYGIAWTTDPGAPHSSPC